MCAAMNGATEVSKKLLKWGGDASINDLNGINSLGFACARGHLDLVKLLLKESPNLNINHHTFAGHSALTITSHFNHLHLLNFLLEYLNSSQSIQDPIGIFFFNFQSLLFNCKK